MLHGHSGARAALRKLLARRPRFLTLTPLQTRAGTATRAVGTGSRGGGTRHGPGSSHRVASSLPARSRDFGGPHRDPGHFLGRCNLWVSHLGAGDESHGPSCAGCWLSGPWLCAGLSPAGRCTDLACANPTLSRGLRRNLAQVLSLWPQLAAASVLLIKLVFGCPERCQQDTPLLEQLGPLLPSPWGTRRLRQAAPCPGSAPRSPQLRGAAASTPGDWPSHQADPTPAP